MFGTVAGGENPGPGRPEKDRSQCLADDIRVFQATEGSMDSSPSLFGVETVLWPRAAKKSGKWYRGVVDAADRFMKRGRGGEELATPRSRGTPRAATRGKRGDAGGEGSRTDTAVDESRNELVDRVARYRFD